MENLDINDEGSDEEDEKEGNELTQDQTAPTLKSEQVIIDPTFILNKAFQKVTEVGSSTAMVAIRNQKTLYFANLGDSGFILIRFRDGTAFQAMRSTEQQHSFNIPYQLSILPGDKELEILKKKGRLEELKKLKHVLRSMDNNMVQDQPEYADDYSEELQDGDIIISATDGVYDNLFGYEILNCVHNFKLKHTHLCTKEQAEVSFKDILNLFSNQQKSLSRKLWRKSRTREPRRHFRESTRRLTMLPGR